MAIPQLDTLDNLAPPVTQVFGQVQSNRFLSSQDKSALSQRLVANYGNIAQLRMEMESRALRNEALRTNLDASRFQLSQARAQARQREEDMMAANVAGQQVSALLSAEGDPTEKQIELLRIAAENPSAVSASPALRTRLEFGQKYFGAQAAKGQSGFLPASAAQQMDAAETLTSAYGPDIAANLLSSADMSNPIQLGQLAGVAKATEASRKKAEETQETDRAQFQKSLDAVIQAGIEPAISGYEYDDKTGDKVPLYDETKWANPAASIRAAAFVSKYGDEKDREALTLGVPETRAALERIVIRNAAPATATPSRTPLPPR